jgi:predicted transcriptional regulator
VSEGGAGAGNRSLERALAHPLRARALELFGDAPKSPNQVAKELEVDVSSLAYHVRVLRKLGCIELVETKQRRGALEHFYRAVNSTAKKHN